MTLQSRERALVNRLDLATGKSLKVKAVAEAALELLAELSAPRLHDAHMVVERDRVALHRHLFAGFQKDVGQRVGVETASLRPLGQRPDLIERFDLNQTGMWNRIHDFFLQ